MNSPLFRNVVRVFVLGLCLVLVTTSPAFSAGANSFADPAAAEKFKDVIKDYSGAWELYESMAPRTLKGLQGNYTLFSDDGEIQIQIDTLWFEKSGRVIAGRYQIVNEPGSKFLEVKIRGRNISLKLDLPPPARLENQEELPSSPLADNPENQQKQASDPTPKLAPESMPAPAATDAPESMPAPDPAPDTAVTSDSAPSSATKDTETIKAQFNSAEPSNPTSENANPASDSLDSPDRRLGLAKITIGLLRQELTELRRRVSRQHVLQDSLNLLRQVNDSLAAENGILDAMNWESAEKIRSLLVNQSEIENIRRINDSLFFRVQQLEQNLNGRVNVDSLNTEIIGLRETNARLERRTLIIGKLQEERDSLAQLTLDQQATLRRRNSTLANQSNAGVQKQDSLRKLLENLQEREANLNDSLVAANINLMAAQERILQLQRIEETRTARVLDNNTGLDSLQNIIDSLAGRNRKLSNQLLARDARLNESKRQVQFVRDSLKQVQMDIAQDSASQADSAQARAVELAAENTQLQTRLEALETNSEQSANEIRSLNEENILLRQSVQRQIQRNDSLLALQDTGADTQSNDSLGQIVETLSRGNSRLRSEVQSLTTVRESLKTENQTLRDTLNALRTESAAIVGRLTVKNAALQEDLNELNRAENETIIQLRDSLATALTRQRESMLQERELATRNTALETQLRELIDANNGLKLAQTEGKTRSDRNLKAESTISSDEYDSLATQLRMQSAKVAAANRQIKMIEAEAAQLESDKTEVGLALAQQIKLTGQAERRADSLELALNNQVSLSAAPAKQQMAEIERLSKDRDSLNTLLGRTLAQRRQAEVRAQNLSEQVEVLQSRSIAESSTQITQSNEMADSLRRLQAERDRLQFTVAELRGMLNANIAEQEDDASVADELVYVTVGTERELRQRGVIIGRGKNLRVVEPLKPANFKLTRRDAKFVELAERPLAVDRLQLLTHPEARYRISYHPTGSATATLLTLNDPEQFWNASEYLVVVLR